jgi:LL-H family phage holin
MDPFISDVINGLIVALIPLVIGAIGYVGKQIVEALKMRMTSEQYAMLEKIAASTVASVNQTLSTKAGEEKKAAALALVRSECAKRGINLDETAIANAIEAAVYRAKFQS